MNVVEHSSVPKGVKIIVANHPTTTDPFILTTISNGQASMLINKAMFDVPIFGYYLNLAGHIPVIKDEGSVAFQRALNLLKKKVSIIIFVEGDLSKYIHHMGKPKTGAVRLALLTGTPLIPVGISVKRKNIKNLDSVIKGKVVPGKWYFWGKYALTVGKAVNFKGDVNDKKLVKKLSANLAREISKLQEEGRKRIKS